MCPRYRGNPPYVSCVFLSSAGIANKYLQCACVCIYICVCVCTFICTPGAWLEMRRAGNHESTNRGAASSRASSKNAKEADAWLACSQSVPCKASSSGARYFRGLNRAQSCLIPDISRDVLASSFITTFRYVRFSFTETREWRRRTRDVGSLSALMISLRVTIISAMAEQKLLYPWNFSSFEMSSGLSPSASTRGCQYRSIPIKIKQFQEQRRPLCFFLPFPFAFSLFLPVSGCVIFTSSLKASWSSSSGSLSFLSDPRSFTLADDAGKFTARRLCIA
jgi:hypothetical protein